MSDEKPPREPPKLHIVRDDGAAGTPSRISDEQAKQLFMASPHIEWHTWAKQMGWPVTRQRYPEFNSWAQEKKDILARGQAESLSEALFSHHGRWHSDVLKTLKEYPEASDAMMGILRRRLNDIIGTITEDDEQRQFHKMNGTLEYFFPKFDKIDNNELGRLASALRITTDTKHRALMIDKWNVGLAESRTVVPDANEKDDQSWNVVLWNEEKMKADDLKKMMESWYNKPSGHQTIDVTADDEAMETT